MLDQNGQPAYNPEMDLAKKALADKLEPLIISIRDRRASNVEQGWLANHAMCISARHYHQQYVSPAFNYYIPAGRRAFERLVKQGTKQVLPRPQFFEVYPGSETDVMMSQAADSIRAFMMYVLTKQVHIRNIVTQLFRQLLCYDRSILKVSVKVVQTPSGMQIWPHVRPVDPFTLFIYPETSTDCEDAQLIFEDHMMGWSQYEQFVAQGVADPITDRTQLSKPEWPKHLTERLQHQGFSSPSDVPGLEEKDQSGGFLAISEVYFKSGFQWYLAWLLWNIKGGPWIVRWQPFYYPPYRIGFARPMTGESYTSGMASDIEQVQVWLNDSINQGEESRVLASMPPTAIDPREQARMDQFKIGPRKVWPISPDAVKVLNFPDTSDAAFKVSQMAMGMIQELGGGGGIAAGQPGRNMPRSGQAMTNMMNLAMGDSSDLAEIVEQENLNPMLSDIYKVTQMFIPPQQIIRIPGTENFPAIQMLGQDLHGDWTFNWVGSMQSADSEVRAQKLLSFGQMIINMQPMLQQMGYTAEIADLMRMIWREGLGERGLNQIIRPMSPPEQQQFIMMMQMQMAQPKPAAPGQQPMKTKTVTNKRGNTTTQTKEQIPVDDEAKTRQETRHLEG